MARISKTNETRNTSGLLTSKVALVTGGSRGIGRAIAMKLAELGADVAICGRDSEKLRATASALQGLTKRVFWQTADVTRADEVAELFPGRKRNLGRLESWSTMRASGYSAQHTKRAKKSGTGF